MIDELISTYFNLFAEKFCLQFVLTRCVEDIYIKAVGREKNIKTH